MKETSGMDPVRENEGGREENVRQRIENEGGREENVRQRRENEGCTGGREEWDTVKERQGRGEGGKKRQRNTSNYTLSVR